MLTQTIMRIFRFYKNEMIIDLRRTKYEMLAASSDACGKLSALIFGIDGLSTMSQTCP